MPEVPICIYCEDLIEMDNEEYVVTNKAEVEHQRDWLYAHASCYQKEKEKSKQP